MTMHWHRHRPNVLVKNSFFEAYEKQTLLICNKIFPLSRAVDTKQIMMNDKLFYSSRPTIGCVVGLMVLINHWLFDSTDFPFDYIFLVALTCEISVIETNLLRLGGSRAEPSSLPFDHIKRFVGDVFRCHDANFRTLDEIRFKVA